MLPNLHVRKDTKITMKDPQAFIDLITKKASSNPLKKKLQMFIESVAFMAAGGWKNVDLRMQNTLVPGVARIGGKEEFVRGYLWECVAMMPRVSGEPTSGTCFLTVNERGLFHMLYGNNPEADGALLYADFIADEEVTENKDTK
jgi:hypothetical protein